MTEHEGSGKEPVWVAIDIAKRVNEVLVELPDGQRHKRLRVANTAKDYAALATWLQGLGRPVRIGFEPTGNYHRPLAYFLGQQGFELALIPSLALARIREARHNSWDKNDPKDAQVILHMLKIGMGRHYHDPLVHGLLDVQELSQTYHQVSLAKTRLQHSLLTHYLPLYFPEVQRYYSSTRAEWLLQFLLAFPTPATITAHTPEAFLTAAWPLVGRKVNKGRMLVDLYRTAQESIGLPVAVDTPAIAMFRVMLRELLALCSLRQQLERDATRVLGDHLDFQRYQSVPGVGPIVALTILAEAGDLRRFGHHRQFLKFCGLDLATQQSGTQRGQTKLSKHGNRRLRSALWMAAGVAIRLRENSFRQKYTRYLRRDPDDLDLRRKARTAVTAKMARVVYGLAKHDTVYRPFHEEAVPSGRTSLAGP